MSDRRIDMLRKAQPSFISSRPYFLVSAYFFAAALTSIALAAVLCSEGRYKEAAAASVAVCCLAFILSARVSIESILITWFVTAPLAYFYIRFPVDKSIITYDRAVFALVILLLWLRNRNSLRRARVEADSEPLTSSPPAPAFAVTKFEIAWALLSVLALASAMIKSEDVAYAARIAVDSFFLPLAAFHIARHGFDARGRAHLLMLSAMALALFLLATGAFEFATGMNLFPYKGSELIREGELRVNGPFAADTSYTIICLFIAVVLQAAPALMRVRLDRVARLVYQLALAAAIIATLLPLFRATAIALVVCWMIQMWAGHKSDLQRAQKPASSLWPLVVMAITVTVLLAGSLSIGRRITDPRNAFGRLATWEAAGRIALEHPLTGCGLTNYREYFHTKYNWEDESVESVLGARAADSPHSNPLWIAADLGLVALALYLTANLYLFFMGWRAMKECGSARGRAAAAGYLALLAAYWIPGLTLASGYYSDLNLYFFFMLGLLLNRSVVR